MYGLIMITIIIGTIATTIAIITVYDELTWLMEVAVGIYAVNSIFFLAITAGLIVSTILVSTRINNLKTFRKQVIKDKCAMNSLTIIFTTTYFMRSVFLIAEIPLVPDCKAGGTGTGEQLFTFYIWYLVMLPLTDCVPILVILGYHLVTMRGTPVY